MQLISTAVRQRDAIVYRDLAAAAHAAGFPKITPGQVHEWVMDGLLPPTADQHSVGRHGFESVRRPGVEDQLLALCRLRAQTKSWDRLAILLWLDRWEITTDRIRRAVLCELPDPAMLKLNPAGERGLDRLDRYAQKLGPAFARRAGLGHVGPEAAASGYFDALVAALGGEPLEEETAQAVEPLAGLSRARTDTLDESGPWLDGSADPGIELPDAARLRKLVSRASEAELEAAQRRARFLAIDLPLLARAAELQHGHNALGLGWLARGLIIPDIAVALALHFATIGLAYRMDAMADTWFPVAAQVAERMPIVEAYLARHPEQRAAIRRVGLEGLSERGELIPMEPEELAAQLAAMDNSGRGPSHSVPD